MDLTHVISLISGVALFLFGMTVMGDGLKSVAGNKLELILYRLSNTKLKGVLLGTGVTAAIQSSCATSVMTVGFVNSGMMKVNQAISVILGAILGTSVTGWVICLSYIDGGSGIGSLLSTATLTGIIAVVGIILRMFCKSNTKKKIGEIMMGFAVLMFGMSTMSSAVSPLGEMESFRAMLTSMSNPLLGILAGTLFTAVLQSASAAVGIIQALSVTGALTLDSSLTLLMGVAIGASFPVLLSAIGAKTEGKRTAMVYLISSAVSVMTCAAIFYILNAIFDFSFMTLRMDPFSTAMVNSVLRLSMVVILFPFTDVIEVLINLLIREKKNKDGDDPSLRLEDRFIAHPAIAIEQSRITIDAMADHAAQTLGDAFSLIDTFTEEGYEEVKKLESLVDQYEDSLGSYLIKLTGRELSKEQNKSVSLFLHTLSDFERISDHAQNIAESAAEIHSKKIRFSDEAIKELQVVVSAVGEIVRISSEAFKNSDTALATRVEPLEEHIDDLCDQLKHNHVERLQKGQCTITHGFVFNDILTNCERISDHCSNIAVAMIELELDAFDTHEYMNRLKETRTDDFKLYFEEYSKKYAV